MSGRKYENADFRIFDFAEEQEGDEEVGGRLVEWELTEKKGGGLGKSPLGSFPMSPGEYPDDVGEIVDETAKDVK